MPHAPRLSRRKCMAMLTATPFLGACAADRPAPRRSRAGNGNNANVALLLPLSGARAGLGQRMAKAVWLVEDLGGAPGRTRILDAGETPQAAADAARDAVGQGADIIVGPLFREQTPAVVEAVGKVPVLSLSNDASLTASGAWVFGVTPAQSVGTVLDFANDTGARRLAVLETPGALGQRAVDAVRSGAARSGVGPVPVVPAATRPAQMAQALKQSGGGVMPDIVYIPGAGPDTLQLAVSAVQSGVTTIGSLQWSGLAQPQLDRLDKACFTGPDPVRFNRLSSTYRAQLDEEMGVIAALAVDAVGLAHAAGGAKNLSRRDAFEGLIGETRFGRDRTCQRRLAILRIDGGDVLPVT